LIGKTYLKDQGLEAIARETWDRVIERGEKYGFRNAQATCEAPTGTIGFYDGL